MATHRSLDSDFWTSPRLRKYPWHARMLLAGLITHVADDEGRFDADPGALIEIVFARRDPVTEEDVQAGLEMMVADGTVILYGDALQYGFLTGWYRRQVMDKRLRRPSTRPEPPITQNGPITSWAFADAIARAATSETARGNAKTVVSCREYCALPAEERDKLRKELAETDRPQVFSVKNSSSQIIAEKNGKKLPDGDGDGDGDGEKTTNLARARVSPPKSRRMTPPPPNDGLASSDSLPDESAEQPESAPDPAGQCDPDDQAHIDRYLEMIAGMRAVGLPDSQRKKLSTTLANIRGQPHMTSEAFRHGITEAIKAHTSNPSYVQTAAESYEPPEHWYDKERREMLQRERRDAEAMGFRVD